MYAFVILIHAFLICSTDVMVDLQTLDSMMNDGCVRLSCAEARHVGGIADTGQCRLHSFCLLFWIIPDLGTTDFKVDGR